MKNIQIGLSQWSFHRSILGDSRNNYEDFLSTLHSDNPEKTLRGEMDYEGLLDVAESIGVKVIDLVNILFFGRVSDERWLKAWKASAAERGITFNCLMCDELGPLGSSSDDKRADAIQKHKLWIDAANLLGCSMVRVNAYGDGSYFSQLNQNALSISELSGYSEKYGIKIVVENHGHPSSNGAWLAMLMEHIADENVGVYIDFDNFFMGGWNHTPKRLYDRQQGLLDLAPYTFGASAKSYEFDEDGNETNVDFKQCIDILKEAGFSGVMSAEYEGDKHNELDGVVSTLRLLRRII
ncbi:sugar phosphate isomerase/epimerase family protein [Vibrio algarum]|uniref:Sugar phosphate isomerase/epimerase n=1 Tax=Vibrio algarum TaxID=3020714 RepID=A0ABT4YUV9_9VIBR|nr:sugar phosphate isomerase/epimerase family protein [Vibrio sp. KJ40-1]MDB1125328.1 sugar phosphate isomerase/epimerase [Vibrio sp. KJ40-1]